MWIGFELVVRAIVGGLFVAAGVAKLSATTHWRQAWLASYQLVPTMLVRPVAWGVPLSELVVGIVLVVSAFGRAGAVAAAAVLLVVTVAVISALMRGLRVSCGCFGTLGDLISWRIVARNLVLIAALTSLAVHGLTGPGVTMLTAPVQALVVMILFTVAVVFSWRQHHPRSAPDTEPDPAAAIHPDTAPVETPPQ